MAHSPYAGGDGDWEAYYKNRCTITNVNRRLIKVEELIKQGITGGTVDLSELEESIQRLTDTVSSLATSVDKLKKDVQDNVNSIATNRSAIDANTEAIANINVTGGYDDTDIRKRLKELDKEYDKKFDMVNGRIDTEVLPRIVALENISYDDTKAAQDFAELKVQVLELSGSVTDKTDEITELREQLAALKASGYDTTELEQRIKAIETGNINNGGNSTLTSIQMQLDNINEGRSGITAQLSSKVSALENGSSGAVASNRSEIESVKQRVDRLESKVTW